MQLHTVLWTVLAHLSDSVSWEFCLFDVFEELMNNFRRLYLILSENWLRLPIQHCLDVLFVAGKVAWEFHNGFRAFCYKRSVCWIVNGCWVLLLEVCFVDFLKHLPFTLCGERLWTVSALRQLSVVSAYRGQDVPMPGLPAAARCLPCWGGTRGVPAGAWGGLHVHLGARPHHCMF